jgi:predicted DNA-binding transcriptional regulator AlpA
MTNAQLLTAGMLSDEIQVPTATLAQWRYRSEGPPFVRLGRHVRYRREDVDAWLAASAVETGR